MNETCQPWTQDQAYLLPPWLRDWLPEDHLAWFILDVISQLDLSVIERTIQSKDAQGQSLRRGTGSSQLKFGCRRVLTICNQTATDRHPIGAYRSAESAATQGLLDEAIQKLPQ